MRKITYLCLLLFCAAQIHAQIQISGKVIDGVSGEPLPGTSVSIEGTNIGTITNVDGTYTINANSEEDILVFSFIGYLNERIQVGENRQINVTLLQDITELDDVVVTALGIKREKKALGYAVQDVKGDELNKTQQTNIVNSLAGKVAGVQITNSSGAVGASSVIKIRGNKSLTGDSQPLFVIDGVPIQNTTNNARSAGDVNVDFGNAAMDIDPANVESVSILKGPNATALYGARGANGVILITTKKGSKGQNGIGVEFSSSASIDQAYFFPDYQNEYGQGLKGSEYIYNSFIDSYYDGDPSQLPYNQYVDERVFRWSLDGGAVGFDADESWGARLDAGLLVDQMHGEDQPWVSRPDNVKNFFETGFSTKNNIAFTAATEKTNARITFSHQDSKGIIPNTDQTTFNFGANASAELGDRLTASASANYIELSNDNLPSLGRNFRNPFYALNGWFGRQVDLEYVEDRYDEIVDVNGDPMAFNWMLGYPRQHPNPYWVLYKNTMSRDRKRFYGNTSLTLEIMEGINLVARAGTDTYTEDRNYIYHQYTRKDWTLFDEPKNGAFQSRMRQSYETNLDLMLTIDQELSPDLTLAATFGANARHNQSTTSTITANELVTPNVFNTANIQDEPEVGYYIWRKKTSSVFGSTNLGFKNYLFLDLSLRGDWSSTLPPENWNYWYPSAGLGFIFTEAFDINATILDYGKVRAGYAIAGNDAAAYQLQPTMTSLENSFNDIKLYYLSTSIPSPTLKPEQTHSFEAGLELKFYENRLGTDLTYYKTNTFNQLMSVPVPYSSGFNYWYKNAGDIENKGLELQLYGKPIKDMAGLNWDVNINWWTNKNEVISLDDGIEDLSLGTSYSNASVYLKAKPGEPWGAIYGYAMARNDNGDVLVSERGYPVAEDSLTIIGNVQPKWEAGIRNSLSYKNFSFGALIRVRSGGDVVSVTKSVGQKTGILQVTVEDGIRENGMIIDGVYEEGAEDDEGNDISGQPNETRVSAQSYWGDSRNYSELAIFDGSYIKLSELTLAYKIPNKILSPLKIQSASLTFFARNLAILWVHESNDANIDPEVSAGASISGTGLEESQIPAPRTLGLKLNVKF